MAIKENEEKDRYDFSNLTFEELFKVPVVEMSFRGEPLSGPDFFELNWFDLHTIPVFLSTDKDKLTSSGAVDSTEDSSFDFSGLSFEELLKVPVRVSRWQDNDSVPEPDLDNLSLEDLMRLPVRRTFVSDLDPDALKKLLGGEDFFSDLPATESGNSGGNSSGLFFQENFGGTGSFSNFFVPINNNTNDNNQNNLGSSFSLPPPINTIPVAYNDGNLPLHSPGQYFAIKSFGTAPQNIGNLFNNDQPGQDTPIQIYNSINPLPGILILNFQNGDFNYLPPVANNPNPGLPTDYAFFYSLIDSNGSLSNYASVSLRVYDPPVLHINDVKIIEGSAALAIFTVILTGAIPIPLSIHYSTKDGTGQDHQAISGEDYSPISMLSGHYTFNNLDPSVTSQQFSFSVAILNDNIRELVQNFQVKLNVSGTFVNVLASDLIGEGAISDPDSLEVNDILGGKVYESGLNNGSNPDLSPDPTPLVQTGNLLAGQNFGQIPSPDNIDISSLSSSDQSEEAFYNSDTGIWTLSGNYFKLTVYNADSDGHSKGDYIYTLTHPVQNTGNADFTQSIQFSLTPIDPGSEVDQDSRTGTGTLSIQIVDDIPIAEDNNTGYAIQSSNSSQYSSGNLLSLSTQSADQSLHVTSIRYQNNQGVFTTVLIPEDGNSGSISSFYGTIGGTLTVHADGQYAYVPNGEGPGTGNIQFDYTIQDADGSISTASVDIQVYAALMAENDIVSAQELALSSNTPVNVAASSGNLLTNDSINTGQKSLLSVSSIEFTVSNLDPDLSQSYKNQGANIIITNVTDSTVQFQIPANTNSTNPLSITLPDSAELKIASNGHYDFFQPLGGISQDTTYDFTYSITAQQALPLHPGENQAHLTLTLNDGVIYANHDLVFWQLPKYHEEREEREERGGS